MKPASVTPGLQSQGWDRNCLASHLDDFDGAKLSARLSVVLNSDRSKVQKPMRPLLVAQSGFWLPPLEASWSCFLAPLY